MTRNNTVTVTAREVFLNKSAEQIRLFGRRAVQDVVEIGRLLTECKAKLGHGEWLPWIEREFGWSDRTARNFMNVYQMLSSKSETVSNLAIDAKALYALAAKSMPNSVREQILARARQGEHVSYGTVAVTVGSPPSSITNTDPVPYGTPTETLTGTELMRALANRRTPLAPAPLHPNELAAARHRSELENARNREALNAHLDRMKNPEPAEPQSRRMSDPVEQWMFEWPRERLTAHIIAADRVQAGFWENLKDAVDEGMRAPPAKPH
jgi:hypothetical protein